MPSGYWPNQTTYEAVKLAPGTPVKVVATGDEHEGQVGVVNALVDEDEEKDGLDVCVKFSGDNEVYAFSHDELMAVQTPTF